MNKPFKNSNKTSIHFEKSVFIVCVLFIACVVVLWISLGRYDSNDESAYHKLTQRQNGLQENNAYTSRQWRQDAQKDVFFDENGQRLQLRVHSARAQLAVDRHDDQTEIVEHMEDVVCCMQEELFYQLNDGREAISQKDGRLLIKHADPELASSWLNKDDPTIKPMQLVRLVDAGTAFYYYKNNQFLAENVKVAHYVASGHSIEQAAQMMKPIMDGTASWVDFSLAGNGINFKAYQLKAKLYAASGKGL